jgi:hypothetical protein
MTNRNINTLETISQAAVKQQKITLGQFADEKDSDIDKVCDPARSSAIPGWIADMGEDAKSAPAADFDLAGLSGIDGV